MRSVAYKESRSIEHPEALVDVDLPEPTPGANDLLVRIEAISVNPVDFKIRQGVAPSGPKVLGWDAVGVVVQVGAEVRGFASGDRVWYAGDLERPGTNSALHCVDARLVAHAPESLDPADAAALPLTSITAWELLFERLELPLGKRPGGAVLLVSGAAGGVGSIALQLARRLTSATVIATAGREQSKAWVQELGAHHVVDYTQPLRPQLEALGVDGVTHVLSLTHTDRYLEAFADLLVPFGHLALIDDPPALDILPFKRKSLSVHWEFMFTRSMFRTEDMAAQGRLLGDVARLVDAGVLRSTATQNLGPINAANLRRAHALLERGGTRGKVVLAGFED